MVDPGAGSLTCLQVAKLIHAVAPLPLASTHRVSQITFHPSRPYLAVQSHDRTVELFRIRTEDEIRKKQARRRKRQKEKDQAKGKKAAEHDDDTHMQVDGETEENDKIELVDLFTPYLIVRASGKIRSFDFADDEASRAKGTTQLFTALSNNALEVYSIPPPLKSKDAVPEASRVYSVDLPGHRTDVRTLCLSSDDTLLASGSNGSLKIWNMKTTACIRTMECGHAVCSTFLPGDRQVRHAHYV